MNAGNIEVRIEGLVLHGFAPGDRYFIGDAVERELVRLFVERGIPPSLVQESEIERLADGTFEVTPGSGAGAIGVQVAQAAYGGLSA